MGLSLEKIVRQPWESILALRPTFALAAVWLTTAGHTMTFREMDAERGWVTTEGYSLHSIYLAAITLTLLAAPGIAARLGSYATVVVGLVMLAAGAADERTFALDTARRSSSGPGDRRYRSGDGDPRGAPHSVARLEEPRRRGRESSCPPRARW